MDPDRFYIDGQWCRARESAVIGLVDPATEREFARVAEANDVEVDRACRAAARAAPGYAATTLEQRTRLLERLLALYDERRTELADLIRQEMGAPRDLAEGAQAAAGARQLRATLKAARRFRWRERLRNRNVVVHREPIGVCALITPWNWPLNQIMAKLAPALAAGCTVVLKPSETTPLSALAIAELVERAGVPPGVFNLVNGRGPTTGAALAAHPLPRMVSFTGSLEGGRAVTIAAAATVKRVTLELGGKSPYVVFADCDVARVVARGVRRCFLNSGQSCNAPSRMLVERGVYAEAIEAARGAAEATAVAPPSRRGRHLGPLAGAAQFRRVQRLIGIGVEEGARLITGGLGRPEDLERGYYVRPTVFADVDAAMRVAREEIFGPALCVTPFDDEAHAVALANDSDYGLAAYVWSKDGRRARRVARALEAGTVRINGARSSASAPFGGYKRSGNGREHGEYGLAEYLEIKSVGYVDDDDVREESR